ncbi:MAG TPA: YncE family protein, partial [Gemmatimonadaceae bacterium]|nr:YncE family protein [Gemmatimonadaceae bacterium]
AAAFIRSSMADPIASAPAPLRLVADVLLPGPASRFDYQSIDAPHHRRYIAHLGAGVMVIFDTKARRVLATVGDVPRVTGVLAVPATGHVYASAAGAHRVAVIDASTLRIVAQLGDITFPDGIAYAPDAGRVFVSDEAGRRELVIDARTNQVVTRIPLGGEAGNTQYDPVARRVLVAVQTRNQLVAIDPQGDTIIARFDLRGADHPHGVYIDAPRRLAFVANEGNATLLVVDLRSMQVTSTFPLGDDPDVLAFDPGLRRLYVASESGVISVFDESDEGALQSKGTYRAPHAHSVAVDPTTHLVYLPLQNVGGRPVLRILAPT